MEGALGTIPGGVLLEEEEEEENIRGGRGEGGGLEAKGEKLTE